MSKAVTFGSTIAEKRKEKKLSQKELAERIKREDGAPISPQYLNDIERDRRSPSSELMVKQLAQELDLDPDRLYFLAGRIPADLLKKNHPPERIAKAMVAFRKSLEK
jgi:transcriptional regulator with XRE-family HTH domain